MNNIIPAISSVKNGHWNANLFQGRELAERNICVIGTGSIGKKVIQLSSVLGMNVSSANSKTTFHELNKMLFVADIISLNLPLTDTTMHLINKDTLSKLKSNVVLINTSRGGLINEKALYTFLKENKEATAVLDVLEAEPPPKYFYLNKLENVIITPHLGWNSTESAKKLKSWLFTEIMNSYDKLEH